MPKMNGLEVLQRVREVDHGVGVIMVTGLNEEETGRQALKLGAFDYITKPLDLQHPERSYHDERLTVSSLGARCGRHTAGKIRSVEGQLPSASASPGARCSTGSSKSVCWENWKLMTAGCSVGIAANHLKPE